VLFFPYRPLDPPPTLTNTALSPSNADCERGFSAVKNIMNDRSLITKSNAANLLFISTVGPLSQVWDPDPYVKTWLGKRIRAAHPTSRMACQKPKEDNSYEPLWKAFK